MNCPITQQGAVHHIQESGFQNIALKKMLVKKILNRSITFQEIRTGTLDLSNRFVIEQNHTFITNRPIRSSDRKDRLLDIGRRRIAFVAGPQQFHQVSDRLAGARTAVAEVAGATLEVLQASDLTVLAGHNVGDLLAERTGDSLPDGLFCTNDLLALGVIQSLTMLHTLRIPEDVALVGYDDIDFAVSAVVPLTSIRQPTALIGRAAIELLAEQMVNPDAKPRSVVFKPELVVRASTVGTADH